jgi:hypothetical protein
MVLAVLHEPPIVAKLNDRWCWQFYMKLLYTVVAKLNDRWCWQFYINLLYTVVAKLNDR